MNTLLFYNIIIFISTFFMYLATKNKGQKKENSKNKSIKISKIFLALSILIPFLVLILRDESVGLDYSSYIKLYKRFFYGTLLYSDLSWVNYGYVLLTKIFILIFSGNYYYFFGIIGFMTIYCFFKTIYDESEIPWMSLLLLFSFCLYYQMFNQFRQMLAISITFYGFKFIKEKKLIKYIITILIAFSIHKSAIVMLPCYWISNIKLEKRGIIFYTIISVIFYNLYNIFEMILIKTDYGQTYLADSYYNVVENSSIFNLVFRIIIFVFCYYLTRKDKNNKSDVIILRNLCFICVLFQVLTIKSYIFGRVTTYFFVYFILFIPKAINNIKVDRKLRVIINLIFIILCIIYHKIYFTAKAASGFGVGIYKFFFE